MSCRPFAGDTSGRRRRVVSSFATRRRRSISPKSRERRDCAINRPTGRRRAPNSRSRAAEQNGFVFIGSGGLIKRTQRRRRRFVSSVAGRRFLPRRRQTRQVGPSRRMSTRTADSRRRRRRRSIPVPAAPIVYLDAQLCAREPIESSLNRIACATKSIAPHASNSSGRARLTCAPRRLCAASNRARHKCSYLSHTNTV